MKFKVKYIDLYSERKKIFVKFFSFNMKF